MVPRGLLSCTFRVPVLGGIYRQALLIEEEKNLEFMLLSLLGHFLYTEWRTCTHWHATKSTRDNSCVLCVVHFLNGTGLSSVGRINILNVCMFILILFLKCRKENPLWVIYRMIFITSRKKKKIQGERELCITRVESEFPSNHPRVQPSAVLYLYGHSVSNYHPVKRWSGQEDCKIFH